MQQYRVGPETQRLIHREMTLSDAEAVFALNTHPDVMRYTAEPPLESLEAAREKIAGYPDFDTVGYGRWGCVLKETDTLIGFCGLKYLSDLDEIDIGYRLLPEYWGRGLATEACRACIEFGFQQIGLRQIIGLVLPENVASIRVLEKSGLKPDGELVEDGHRVLRFVINAEQSF